uniref:SITS-binding protein-like isoform X2 n=1 Tax=Petromyzon marinus TaxID=7757 RepID=A0AAJ7WZJ8_PETMA|nr:SITS-binding protein-like isoform X2 [Petromyzon marinus]
MSRRSSRPDTALYPSRGEMYESWRGGVACLCVAIFFLMTVAIIYWQVVDTPERAWALKAASLRSGLAWDARALRLVLARHHVQRDDRDGDVDRDDGGGGDEDASTEVVVEEEEEEEDDDGGGDVPISSASQIGDLLEIRCAAVNVPDAGEEVKKVAWNSRRATCVSRESGQQQHQQRQHQQHNHINHQHNRHEHASPSSSTTSQKASSSSATSSSSPSSPPEFCERWEAGEELRVRAESVDAGGHLDCYHVEWTYPDCRSTLQNCFVLPNGTWFGWSPDGHASWPLADSGSHSDGRHRRAPWRAREGYFLGSTGVALFVTDGIPVLIPTSPNTNGGDSELCLRAVESRDTEVAGSSVGSSGGHRRLLYSVCAARDVRAVHRGMRSRFYAAPDSAPLPDLLWSLLWHLPRVPADPAALHRAVRGLARKLHKHAMGDSVISLGEAAAHLPRAATAGPLVKAVDPASTPLPAGVSLCVAASPFLRADNPEFDTSLRSRDTEQLWVSDPAPHGGDAVPQLVRRDGRLSLQLDVTREMAWRWLESHAGAALSWTGAGRLSLLLAGTEPPGPATPCRGAGGGRGGAGGEERGDDAMRRFSRIAMAVGNGTVVSDACRSSEFPLYVALPALESSWGPRGLGALIPSALLASLHGYRYFIPDAVGGTASRGPPPEKMLFVRWMQITAFLPVMSFLTPPWHYDNETASLSLRLASLHRSLVAPLLRRLAESPAQAGRPLVRPLWWLDPRDPVALSVHDEFLLGDTVRAPRRDSAPHQSRSLESRGGQPATDREPKRSPEFCKEPSVYIISVNILTVFGTVRATCIIIINCCDSVFYVMPLP